MRTCGELARCDVGRLSKALGAQMAAKLRGYAKCADKRPWEPRPVRKSIGAQSSWGVRFETAAEAATFARKLCDEVGSRLGSQGKRGAQLTLKLWRAMEGADGGPRKGSMGHGACDICSRSITLPAPTADAALIAREVSKILTEVRIHEWTACE